MKTYGAKLFESKLDNCIVSHDAKLPGAVIGQVVGVDLGIGANGVYVLGHLCKGGVLRIFKCGELGVCGLASCFDTVCVHLGIDDPAWVMGWDGGVKQSLTGVSAAEWLRDRKQHVVIVHESVAGSLSRLGRCLGNGPSDLKVEIEPSCTGLIASLRHYRAGIPDDSILDNSHDWPRHFVDALRYAVTPNWQPMAGRHPSAIAAGN